MRIHYIQHVEFEDPANILLWADENRHHVSKTALYNSDPLPYIDNFDWLVIMGGPMSVGDDSKYNWLREEKKFIERAIICNKTVIGICLGAQLIASVLGAKVYKNKMKEIGWFPVKITSSAGKNRLFEGIDNEFVAFHWHGDTFDIPEGAMRIASSEATLNQGFLYKNNVVALQFHLESTPESVAKLIKYCSGELIEDKYIQNRDYIMSQNENFQIIDKNLRIILDQLDNKK